MILLLFPVWRGKPYSFQLKTKWIATFCSLLPQRSPLAVPTIGRDFCICDVHKQKQKPLPVSYRLCHKRFLQMHCRCIESTLGYCIYLRSLEMIGNDTLNEFISFLHLDKDNCFVFIAWSFSLQWSHTVSVRPYHLHEHHL